MKDYSITKRKCPHLIKTKIHAVQRYRKECDIDFVCRLYHISKASLPMAVLGWKSPKQKHEELGGR